MEVSELKSLHKERKEEIQKKLEGFKKLQALGDKDIFAEFCFCLLTPQSKAFNCWNAVLELKETGLLYDSHSKKIAKSTLSLEKKGYSTQRNKNVEREIAKILRKKVRFHNNKAKYIVKNRQLFLDKNLKDFILNHENNKELREWLVENIHGYGYKEASHFLRNIGFRDLAILDRHILKNLVALGVIPEIPKSLTKKKYFEIESKFKKFSEKVGIPMDELDLLFWSVQAGEVFK